MKIKIHGKEMPETVTLELAGLDIPGDITQPCRSTAIWVAAISNAQEVEIGHFLSSIFIIAGDRIKIYWPTKAACQRCLDVQNLSNRPRESVLQEAVNWELRNVKFNPKTGELEEVVYHPEARLAFSPQLRNLLKEVNIVAKSMGLSAPKLEHIFVCLWDNPAYAERRTLEGSGLNINLLRDALKHQSWSIPELGEF